MAPSRREQQERSRAASQTYIRLENPCAASSFVAFIPNMSKITREELETQLQTAINHEIQSMLCSIFLSKYFYFFLSSTFEQYLCTTHWYVAKVIYIANYSHRLDD